MKKFSPILLLWCTVQMLAQSKENKRFVPGFFVGLETQQLGVETLRNFPDMPTAWAAGANAGVTAGIMLRKPIRSWLYFQPEIALTYVENKVIFWPDGPKNYKFFDAEIPLHFVVSDWRRPESPLRGCIIFGGRSSWNFAKNAANPFKISPERFGLDLGLGAEIKTRFWRLQPCFVYSHGLNDLHLLDDAKYDDGVGRMVRDKLSLRLMVWKQAKKKGAIR